MTYQGVHINYGDGQQIVGREVAFGEVWGRLGQLEKFNTCHWHLACTKFGGVGNFATYLLTYLLTIFPKH